MATNVGTDADAQLTPLLVRFIRETERYHETRGGPEVLIVDVGGGASNVLRKAWQGRRDDGRPVQGLMVIQRPPESSMPDVPVRGVEEMFHDPLESQPVKGAQIYLLRYVLRMYSDDECEIILQHTKDAFGPESRLIIVGPQDPEIYDHSTIGTLKYERNAAHRQEILETVGMRVQRTHPVNKTQGSLDYYIESVPVDRDRRASEASGE